MYQALYRKYRPQSFADVVGQNVIVKTLSNSILNNRISHAYLFSGPRGTGKTSVAKIFAKIVNCQNLKGVESCDICVSCTQMNNNQTTDVIEIDAASNNGVDEIREIKNKVNLVPSNGKYKVYIIDEVHMLTTSAFNALLKTLEEPPNHVIFILATTEPHKIPQTIISRCQRYDFKRISDAFLVERLINISENENINISKKALQLVAKISNGGMRDSIGILDQLSSYCDNAITEKEVHEINGTVMEEEIKTIVELIIKRDISTLFNTIEQYDLQGKNLFKVMEQIVEFTKNVLIYINCSDYFNENEIKQFYDIIAKQVEELKLYDYINVFTNTLSNKKGDYRLLFELAILKILGNKSEYTKKITEEKPIKTNNADEKNTKQLENNKKLIDDAKKKKSNIELIQKVRINNTLSKFDKKELTMFKNEIPKIKGLLMEKKYSSIVSLILDGKLKAKGDNNVIFVYKNSSLENYFNNELIIIEELLKKVFNNEYKAIAVNQEKWEVIKKEFNESLKNKENKYLYKEETFNIKELLKKENIISNEKDAKKNNELDDLFYDILEYH